MPRPVGLLETLRLEDGRAPRLDQHIDRLTRSAEYFGFRSVPELARVVRQSIAEAARVHPSGLHRVRVLARPDGTHEVAVVAHAVDAAPRRVALATRPVDSRDRRLYHKLTDRQAYAERLAAAPGADDVILINERGELTETTIGNLVLELDGQKVTPPLDCGLLPGVFRASLLATGEVTERVLYPADLTRATGIWMVNSLREWVPCQLA